MHRARNTCFKRRSRLEFPAPRAASSVRVSPGHAPPTAPGRLSPCPPLSAPALPPRAVIGPAPPRSSNPRGGARSRPRLTPPTRGAARLHLSGRLHGSGGGGCFKTSRRPVRVIALLFEDGEAKGKLASILVFYYYFLTYSPVTVRDGTFQRDRKSIPPPSPMVGRRRCAAPLRSWRSRAVSAAA